MIPVHLTSVKTRDGIVLEGIVTLPKYKRKTALIWIHGLTSRFSSGQKVICEVADACNHADIGYFKFNTRGHDIASRVDKKIIGGGFEHFEDCIYDIRAMIRFAQTFGFSDIILAGHSTGANKALYYCYKTKDASIKRLILLGAISDIVALRKDMGAKKYNAACAIANRLHKNPCALMPIKYGLFSARRFWSLCHPGEKEDVFPYYAKERIWNALESIRIPLAVIFGSRDEHKDRSATQLIDAFRTHAPLAKQYTGIIIKRADHGFHGKEKELSRAMIQWIKQTRPTMQ